MGFKKLVQTIGMGFALWFCLLMTLDPTPLLAATLTEARPISPAEAQTIPGEIMNLEARVDQFLTSIPAGYYAISNAEGLKGQVKNPKTLLIDVREPSEYWSGHIPTALNIPLRSLTQNLDKIARDRPVVLYCSSGHRSAMGVMALHLLGYDNVQGFPPSFVGWKAGGGAIASREPTQSP